MLVKKYSIFVVGVLLFNLGINAQSKKILINEFMASNSITLADEDGDFSDWIELYNPGESGINLKGWYLTDKKDNLTKWDFPEIILAPDSYLVVFASDKKRDNSESELHTNFKLSASGEFLAIVEPDGSSISHSYGDIYPIQQEDISYGLYNGQAIYFDMPTPGLENVAGDIIQDVQFSKTRGFYEEAFEVSLSDVGNGKIYYTTNGSRPTPENGTLFTSPIQISKTTALSAIAVNNSGISSPVISHTYFFIEDILKQPLSPEGFPSNWKMDISSDDIIADYEMDPEVCTNPEYEIQMNEVLTDIPSISIVTNTDYLFSSKNDENEGGIYIYTGKPNGTGKNWVRPTSVEYLDPNTGRQFQINCRLKLHGGNSRNPSNSLKHGFEFKFSSSYGPTKLNFDLFEEESATKEFNSLVLRGGYNYTWVKRNSLEQRTAAQYLQDSWKKTTQLEMGHLSGHERFVHLYLNGLYWGLYNVCEEYTNDFAEEYLKGQEEDFDIIKETQEVTSGTIEAFNNLLEQMTPELKENVNYQKIQGRDVNGSINSSYQNLLNAENYIDYMLINYYLGNRDWNKNNWVMVRNRTTNEEGFRFLCWDAETTMTSVTENMVAPEMDAKNPAWFIQFLIENPDFKVLLADKVQMHMKNEGGALKPAIAAQRYNILAEEINLSIIVESARWVYSNFDEKLMTKNDHWLPRQEDLYTNYFPFRTDIVIDQLKDKGYLNDLDAPVFSHESGEWSETIDLGMTSNKGEIYYTTDGSDPREQISSAVSSNATLFTGAIPLSSNATIKARTKSGDDWSAITLGIYDFGTSTSTIEWVEKKRAISATNYPNPFMDQTTIAYNLQESNHIEIDIFSSDGRWIEKLHSGIQQEGGHSVQFIPKSDMNGMYFYRIQAGNEVITGKMIRSKLE